MNNAFCNYIKEYSINDAWRSVMWLCLKKGYDYKVEAGSYVGQIRKQLPYVCIRIKEPWKRPLAPIVPPNVPAPTSDDKIGDYFANYLMDDALAKNEQYRYSSFIVPQIETVIKKLIDSNGNTNQATISIGDKESIKLSDPPCLRLIDFKVVNGKLNMSVFFRSWDLVAGLPENLGGLQLLKEYVLNSLTDSNIPPLNYIKNLNDGELICYSSGLHIYEQYNEIAKMLNIIEE